MRAEFIFLPAIFLALQAMVLVFMTGRSRVKAAKEGRVPLKYFKLFQGEEVPDRLIALSRNYSNQFELPVLFYLATVIFYVTGNVNTMNMVLCCLFVLTRLLHTVIHIGKNPVVPRFRAFLAGYFILVAIFGRVLQGILF